MEINTYNNKISSETMPSTAELHPENSAEMSPTDQATNNCNGPTTSGIPYKKRKLEINPMTKTAVMLLHNTWPGINYDVILKDGPAHDPTFEACVTINDIEYRGLGGNKKSAKLSAAEEALKDPRVSSLVLTDGSRSITLRYAVHTQMTYSGQNKENEQQSKGGKSAVALLNEKQAGLVYELLHEEGESHKKIFQFGVHLDNILYTGTGKTKKSARNNAAIEALRDKFGICHTSFDKTKNRLTHSPELQVQQQTADMIATKVTEKFLEIAVTAPHVGKPKVLSGFVLTKGDDDEFVKVLTVTTGSKCLSGKNVSLLGEAVNDCHAEVISRRCLISYFYSQLEYLVQGKEMENGDENIFEPRPQGNGYRMKEKFNVNLYISSAPCGDARIYIPTNTHVEEGDNHPDRRNRGLLRNKVEAGEGTTPLRVGKIDLQTFDGIKRYERLKTMCCSDKLCKWNALGLQGALLSHFIEPVYLNSIILGSAFNPSHLYRALVGRIQNILHQRNGPYYLHVPKMGVGHSNETTAPPPHRKSPITSLNWDSCASTYELINSLNGKPIIDPDPKKPSRLSPVAFLSRFSELLKSSGISSLTNINPESLLSNNYQQLKEAALDYKDAKEVTYKAFASAGFGNWMSKPIETDEY